MNKFLLLFSLFLLGSFLSAQEKDSLTQAEKERREQNIQAGNPFKKYGYTPKIATLSKGKYLEWHDLDSIVIIGSVYYNTKTKKITDFVKRDMSNPDAQPLSDIRGRWISPDPLEEEFPSWSPYNFVLNNPLVFTDPTGLAPEWKPVIIESTTKNEQGESVTTQSLGLQKEAGDDAKSLAKFLGVSQKEAQGMMDSDAMVNAKLKSDGSSVEVLKVPETVEGVSVINQALKDSFNNPEKYDAGMFGGLFSSKNYNCHGLTCALRSGNLETTKNNLFSSDMETRLKTMFYETGEKKFGSVLTFRGSISLTV